MKKLILLAAMAIATLNSVAVADQSQYKKIDLSKSRTYKPMDLPVDSVKPGARYSLSTNLLEWAIFAPNLGLEIDLKDPTLMSSPSIYVQASFRPGRQNVFTKGYTEYNVAFWRARFEYRWHFRFNERKEQRRGLTIPATWINENWFTKAIDTEVPDTAAINAGNPYATLTVKSKDPVIDRKIDSTMVSTLKRRTEMFPGRWYAGIYGDIFGYSMNTKTDFLFFGFNKDLKGNLKKGYATGAGLSAGYEFPGFNYNHKYFMQWSVGASAGLTAHVKTDVYSSTSGNEPDKNLSGLASRLSMMPIAELRVALNFRNTTISKKYWMPDNSRYTKNIEQNREDSIHMAELDSILAAKPVVIAVHSVNGFDSAYQETIDKMAIVQAFQQSTGLTYLLPTQFNMLESTEQGMQNKELSDNYFIEYIITNRLRNYEDSVYVKDRKNLPFRVEVAGRAEADSLLKSFKDSLKNYFAANGNIRPILYGEPATKDSLVGYISKDSIAAEFSRIWGHKLDTSMIRKLYMFRTYVDKDGVSSNILDSVIGDSQITRKDQYGMFIQFHPQVTLSAEDFGEARFNVAMAGADAANDAYNSVAKYINSLSKIGVPRIQRQWNGVDDTFENRVTKEEVLELMSKQGLSGYNVNMVTMSDSIFKFNNVGGVPDTVTFNFGVTEKPLQIPFVIEDSLGKAKANELYQAIRMWTASRYWTYIPDDDPIVPAYYDTLTDEWFVSKDKFIEVLGNIEPLKNVTILPHQVDTVVLRVQKTRSGDGYAKFKSGYYRGTAQFKFHRELRAGGKMATLTAVYQLDLKSSMEEAGFMPDSATLAARANAPKMIEPPYTTTELYDEMGKLYKARVYTLDSGEKKYVYVESGQYYVLTLDEFGDVGGKEAAPAYLVEWLTPKPAAPAAPAVKMIEPPYTTTELYDEMGKLYKTRIYTTDSIGTKTHVYVENGQYYVLTLDEFGDVGGKEPASAELVEWLTPKPEAPAVEISADSIGAAIDSLAVNAIDSVAAVPAKVYDLEVRSYEAPAFEAPEFVAPEMDSTLVEFTPSVELPVVNDSVLEAMSEEERAAFNAQVDSIQNIINQEQEAYNQQMGDKKAAYDKQLSKAKADYDKLVAKQRAAYEKQIKAEKKKFDAAEKKRVAAEKKRMAADKKAEAKAAKEAAKKAAAEEKKRKAEEAAAKNKGKQVVEEATAAADSSAVINNVENVLQNAADSISSALEGVAKVEMVTTETATAVQDTLQSTAANIEQKAAEVTDEVVETLVETPKERKAREKREAAEAKKAAAAEKKRLAAEAKAAAAAAKKAAAEEKKRLAAEAKAAKNKAKEVVETAANESEEAIMEAANAAINEMEGAVNTETPAENTEGTTGEQPAAEEKTEE